MYNSKKIQEYFRNIRTLPIVLKLSLRQMSKRGIRLSGVNPNMSRYIDEQLAKTISKYLYQGADEELRKFD